MVVLMRDEMSAIQHLQDLELLSLTHYKAEIYNVSVFFAYSAFIARHHGGKTLEAVSSTPDVHLHVCKKSGRCAS